MIGRGYHVGIFSTGKSFAELDPGVEMITGDRDELMPLPTSLAMRDAVPGCGLAVIPGAAHLPNLERSAVFNAVLRGFLAQLPAA